MKEERERLWSEAVATAVAAVEEEEEQEEEEQEEEELEEEAVWRGGVRGRPKSRIFLRE